MEDNIFKKLLKETKKHNFDIELEQEHGNLTYSNFEDVELITFAYIFAVDVSGTYTIEEDTNSIEFEDINVITDGIELYNKETFEYLTFTTLQIQEFKSVLNKQIKKSLN